MTDTPNIVNEPDLIEAQKVAEAVETVNNAALERLQSALIASNDRSDMLEESLRDVEQMLALEDIGWTKHFGGLGSGELPGPDLAELKKQSKVIREMMVGTPVIGRGAGLRSSYVWSKGIVISGAPDATEDGKKRGPKGSVHQFLTDPVNVQNFVSDVAHVEMERAAYSDGMVLLLGDVSKKTVRPIPLSEITGIYQNPDYAGEIWAYKRSWTTTDSSGERVNREAWYYVDTFTGTPETVIGKDRTPVDKSYIIIDQQFNTQVGWPLGVPDALGAIRWARMYSKLMANGEVMNEAMAKFAYKVVNKSKTGAQNVGVKLANSRGSGQTAAIGQENELQAMPNAGRTYDFNGLRPVVSQVAAYLEVSVVHLLSDPGAAGSSYGSASNLDLPTKRAMVARQKVWVSFFKRVLRWATGKDIAVSFPSLDDPDPYREAQLAAILWDTGVINVDEMRKKAVELGNFVTDSTEAPSGVLLPNNEASLARKDIDSDGSPGTSTGASPDQGKKNGSGGTSDSLAKDLRSDTIEKATGRLQDLMDLDRLEDLVTRLEAARIG